MQTIHVHRCKHCSRTYREKYNLDRHATYCAFLQKSSREQASEQEQAREDVPTVEKMYLWMQEMALRIDKLEKENAKWKQTRRMDVLEWLNDPTTLNTSILDFDEWFQTRVLPTAHLFLTSVFKSSLQQGMVSTLEHAWSEYITQHKCSPIQAFDVKVNTFYILKTGKWIVFDTAAFDKYLSKLARQFILVFKHHWYIPNKDRIDSDVEFQDCYINNYQKILGGNDKVTDDVRYQRVRQALYKKIQKTVASLKN